MDATTRLRGDGARYVASGPSGTVSVLARADDAMEEAPTLDLEIRLEITSADDAFLCVEVDQDERPPIEKTDLRDDGTFKGDGNGSELDASHGQAGNTHRWTFSYSETRTPPCDSRNS